MSGSWNGTTYNGDDTNEDVSGTNADETLFGNGGSDTLHGGGGSDNLYAGGYDDPVDTVDKLYGDTGNDSFSFSYLAKFGSLADGGDGAFDRLDLSVPYVLNGTTLKPLKFTLTQGGSYLAVDGDKGLFVKRIESLSISGSKLGGSQITGGDNSDFMYLGGAGNKLKGLDGADSLATGIAIGATSTIDGGKGDRDRATLLNDDGSGNGVLTLVMSGDLEKGAKVKSGNETVATLKGIEQITVTGGAGNDTLFGAGLDDSLKGGLGKNKLTAGGGNDSLGIVLDDKLDTIKGEGGTDALTVSGFGVSDDVTMSGTLAKLTIKLGTAEAVSASSIEGLGISTGSGDDTLFGGKNNDTFSTSTGADKVEAGSGNDTVSVILDQKLDTIDGGKGKNSLTLYLNAFDKAIEMESTSDTGFDMKLGSKAAMHVTNMQTLSISQGSNLADTLVGLSGDDTLAGGGGSDKISGGKGNDTLGGDSGADTLDGGDGDDSLSTGSGGGDKLIGGKGTDTANLGGFNAPNGDAGLTVTLDGDKTVSATVNGVAWASLAGIENLSGTYYDDHLTGDGRDNVLDGGNGDNVLDGGDGSDTVNYASFFAIVSGLTVTLQGDQDTTVVRFAFFGQPSTDTLRNIENVMGTNGSDQLTGDKFDNRLEGGGGADVLKGGGGDDTLIAGFGLSYGSGVERMEGGKGDDHFTVFSATDIVKEAAGEGDDTVTVAGGGYALAAGQEIETLKAAHEKGFFGFYTPVTLAGNEFANTIAGWKAADTLTGGGGDDTFLFGGGFSGSTFDTITDFSHADDGFHLDHKLFEGLKKNHDLSKKAFDFFDSKHPTKGIGEDVRILYDKKRGDLYFDQDGSGKHEAVKFAHLDKLPGASHFPTVDHTDFFVV